MKFLQRTPFFRLLFPLIAGIIMYQYWELPMWGLSACFVLSLGFIAFSFFLRASNLQYRFRWLFGCGISLFFIAFAYALCVNVERENSFDHLSEKGIFTVELTKAPVEKARSIMCEAKIIQFSDSLSSLASQGKAYIYFQKDSLAAALAFGDRLLVEAEFNPPEGVQNPDGFDYAAYLKRKGIGATAYVASDSWTRIGENSRFSVFALAQQCRTYFLNIYRKFDFKREDFAVLAALTFGYTDELDPDLQASYSASGTTHILSVSGLHVGIIYAVFVFIFGFLNKTQKQRNIRTLLILFLLWFYAFVTGLPPAVFRASLMFSLVAISGLFNRKSLTYNIIFMSAFLMLLINPNLLFDIGFQLSYSAVLSIIYFQPKISRLFYFRSKPAKWVWELAAVSIAAQLGTVPFTLYYFQVFPNYFLLGNMIAVPVSSFILYLGVALLAVASIPVLSTVVAFLLNFFLRVLNISVAFIEHLPYSISVISINENQALLAILTIFLLGYYFYSKRYFSLAAGFGCILAFFAINVFIKYETLQSQKIIVYTGNRNTHVNFIDGRKNLVYTSDYSELHKIASSFWNNKKLQKPTLINEQNSFLNGFIYFKGLRIMILEDDFSRTHTTNEKLKVDYLIIGNGLKPRIQQVLECVEPQHIVTDKTITAWYTNQIKEVCEKQKINFHSTRLSGAFVAKLGANRR